MNQWRAVDMFLGQNLLEQERKEMRSRLKTALFFPIFFRLKSFLNGRFFRFFPFLRLVSRFFPFFSSSCLFQAVHAVQAWAPGPKIWHL